MSDCRRVGTLLGVDRENVMQRTALQCACRSGGFVWKRASVKAFEIRSHLFEPVWKAGHYGANGVVCGWESISSSGSATFVESFVKTTGITSLETAAS